MFWKRTTQQGGLAGLIAGMISALLMNLFKDSLFTIEEPFLYVSWWSFVVGFVVTVMVTLFTKPYEDSKLLGLVYRLAENTQKTQ
jgi:SSS family solute:Na+ symporter